MKAHYSSENTSINQKMQGHMQMYDSDTQEKKNKQKKNIIPSNGAALSKC